VEVHDLSEANVQGSRIPFHFAKYPTSDGKENGARALAISPLSHGGHIVPGDQKSFVSPRQASQSKPWGRGLAW